MSELWKRKMRTFFHLFDFDKDGVITKNDWMAMPDRFAKSEKADKQKTEYLKTQFHNVWVQFMKKAVTDDKERLTVDQFIDAVGKQLYNPELIKHFSGMIYGFFDQMDINCDGYLQPDEHRRLFDHLGVPDTSFTMGAFRAIDVNHDGKLCFEEYVPAFFDFLFSKDATSPNKFFFGPLVD